MSGGWVDDLTGLNAARIRGIHLYLPGYESDGPTIEIFEYDKNLQNSSRDINRDGFGHIAFAVEDVQQKLDLLLENGGSALGDLIDAEIAGVGRISVVYARDPEGNIVELQKWS